MCNPTLAKFRRKCENGACYRHSHETKMGLFFTHDECSAKVKNARTQTALAEMIMKDLKVMNKGD